MARVRYHKPRQNRLPDTSGDHTSIDRGDQRREWQWGLPLDWTTRNIPLVIRHCGNAVWEQGITINRTNSNIFAMELVTRGSVSFTQGDKKYLVQPGELYLLHKGRNHTYETGPDAPAHKRYLCIDGKGQVLRSMLHELGLLNTDVIKLNDVDGFIDLFKEAAYELEYRTPGFLNRLSGLAYRILLFLGGQRSPASQPAPVLAALDFMLQNSNRPVTLKELADAAHLSVPHFSRLFVKSMGKPPLEYFRKMKTDTARQLLLGSSARIADVAARLGYEDCAYFTRVFTKAAGMSPRAFRKKMKPAG